MEKLAAFYAERAQAGVGLIVTGGIAPNWRGALAPFGASMSQRRHARKHRLIPQRVHAAGGKILLQLLHGGRYSHHPFCIAPSALKAPIARFRPRALSGRGVLRTIKAYGKSAKLAQLAGYDGVEIMGSEGYLINQFLVKATNRRTDRWGGSFEKRMQFPLEIVREIKRAVGEEFLIMFRLSMLDLVADGSNWEEVIQLAQALENEGVHVINTGIGWHEARIPTIASLVPHGGFAWVTQKMMGKVTIPLVTTNRFNMPDQVEQALRDGCADLVSMARPFLADAHWIEKAKGHQPESINTCIGCNQACLDHIFKGKTATCLVNPRAGRETEKLEFSRTKKRVLVVGGGPAGMSCAAEASRNGHDVRLIEASESLGGQFKLAQRIPGKEDFLETTRYFKNELKTHQVEVITGRRAQKADASDRDVVILATGVKPRHPAIFPSDSPLVQRYDEALRGLPPHSGVIAVIGSGGIGFDVADWLSHGGDDKSFNSTWGIDDTISERGGLSPHRTNRTSPVEVHVFQRSTEKPGANLGKTTGWIHRVTLRERGVQFHVGVEYVGVEDGGLRYIDAQGKEQQLICDRIILCAGQVSENGPSHEFSSGPWECITIGGALNAKDIDAQRAIREGWECARSLG